MKANKRLITLISLVLIVSLALAGCSSANNPNSQKNDSKDGNKQNKPVELTIWGGYPELDPWYKKMAEDYKKEHPNVTVNIASFPLRDFEKKVAAGLPSSSAADIVSLNPVIALRFIQGNMLKKAPDDLSQLVTGGNYPDLIADRAQVNDVVYGIPHQLGKGVIYYNTKMFAEAGLTEPPSSIDQFLEYAQKLAVTDASGNLQRAGMSLRLTGGGSGLGEKFWTLLAQHGGSIVKEVSPGKYVANYDNEAGLKTLQMYIDMVHKYKTDDPTIKHDAEAFEMEMAAFFVRESWVIGDIKQKAPDLEYATAPLPVANVIGMSDFYVTNAAKEKEEAAWEFIRFLMKPENHKQMVEMTGWLPAREDLDFEDFFKENPAFKAFFTKQELHAYPTIPEFDEILTKFADRLSEKGFTDASFVDNPDKMKAFLADLAKDTNAILKKAGHLAE
ncbi:extracellular solute-binding protein [Paenibacillus pinisoli]|uniref:Extracellular solute-binding protein n=1 Tax=Paenibacillus pinisoli TaxID=1276110 RepID=A0A3A6Q1B1_9BACL|nr:extracellular solute-binding protein [Paenibacillus pinisoli]RJX41273.1 extracellular solute-binding protein [Paenibacillus pinisoli]